MGKLFISITLLVAGLSFFRISSFAASEQYPNLEVAAQNEIIGEIANYDSEQDIITIKGKDGKIYSINVIDPEIIKGFRVGEEVIVRTQNGEAVSIESVEGEFLP